MNLYQKKLQQKVKKYGLPPILKFMPRNARDYILGITKLTVALELKEKGVRHKK